MDRARVEEDLVDLPSPEYLLAVCSSRLSYDVLASIREMELDSSDTLGCLWAELLDAGVDPEEFLRERGIIR
ncbi:hypothetical protein IPM44_04045 [bacterium]|nr:MAG: hypothetical protein IPM44_04045 [bacterium]